MKWFNNVNISRLKEGMTKTRDRLVNKIIETLSGKAVIDDNTLNELEEILISSDLNSELAEKIIGNLRINLNDQKDRTVDNIITVLKKELLNVLEMEKSSAATLDSKPYVILIVGVNGVGKTTTVGKLANNFKIAGNRVLIGSADTFRAAANEQLDIWAKRAGVEIIQHKQGADPSSVAFETVKKAKSENYDLVLIDTAGRLHSKVNLMNELNKINKALSKVLPSAPNDTYLVLDASVGQNAIVQADEFSKVTKLTGFVITKLDGTAKGGTIFSIANKHKIPVKYIGVGEKIEDLQVFSPSTFIDAIFTQNLN